MTMIIKQRLDQKQVQKLILAPALQQAIKLLPLTNLELIEAIDTELAQNPLIEVADETDEQTPVNEPSLEEVGVMPVGQQNESSPEIAEFNEDVEFDRQFEENVQKYLYNSYQSDFMQEKREVVSLENFIAKTPSLWDHLNWQASLTFFEPTDLEIAQFIIGNINEDGYLTSSLGEIASLCRTTVEKVEEIRQKIKTFDPVGSGSLTLSETLIAQMNQLQVNDEVAMTIVSQHLNLIEKSEFDQLARVLNMSLAELKPHLDIIKTLDPAPGRKYSSEKTNYVVPDLIVSREGDEWVVTVNEEGLPKLKINHYYRRLLSQTAKAQPEACAFLKDRFKKALWFIRSIEQRNQTIYKVAKYIINEQTAFLEKGLAFLKPLTLKEVADAVGFHESTVGRVVANKYVQTPLGVFSLKYFFHKSILSDQGEDVSSLLIKEKIKKIVETEDKKNPLSDSDLKNILERENIKLARRTVTKYRKQLRIEPSHIRKRKFIVEGKQWK